MRAERKRESNSRTGKPSRKLRENINRCTTTPFLPYFLGTSARLGSDELLEVSNRVVFVALDSHLFPEAIVANDLNHFRTTAGNEQYPTVARNRLRKAPKRRKAAIFHEKG